MKKTLLCLCAFLLSVAAVNAQSGNMFKKASPNAVSKKVTARVSQMAKKAPSVPNRIDLDDDENIVGFYTSDELDLTGSSSLTLNGGKTGTYTAGVILPAELFTKYVGAQITKVRFGMGEAQSDSRVVVMPVDLSQGVIGDPLAECEVPSTVEGWNDVTLSTPVTIEENVSYLIGYDFLLQSSYNPMYGTYVGSNYPLLVDYVVNPGAEDPYGSMVLGDLGQGEAWYSMAGQGIGNFCIQAVVKGNNFIDDDIEVNDAVVPEFNKPGESMDVSFGIRNWGANEPSSYTLNVSVDDEVVKTLDTPVALTNTIQTVEESVVLPDDLAAGAHVLKVSVATINGKVPTENTADDEASASFKVYLESVPRQKSLVEEFTSTACPYCPLGHDVLNKLIDMREDLAVAVLHNNYPGVSTLGTTETDQLSYYLCQGYSNPSGTFNRYYVDDASVNTYNSLNLVLSYQSQYATQAAQMFSSIIDESNQMPAFASVDIATDYDAESRKLNITVSGNAVDGFSGLVGEDAVLTVYVTEDDIVAAQSNNGVTDRNYVHNNIVRDIVSTSIFGDPIAWTGSNTYSNAYTITLDDEWNVENMHVLAFISRPVVVNGDQLNSVQDMWVNNANSVKIDLSTGIDGVESDGEAVKEVARYSVDGARISAPVKGINIIKMSDGTTRKVMIAE